MAYVNCIGYGNKLCVGTIRNQDPNIIWSKAQRLEGSGWTKVRLMYSPIPLVTALTSSIVRYNDRMRKCMWEYGMRF